MNRGPFRLALLLIPLAVACFALSPLVRAVDPPPDGGYPNQNTAEGEDALFSLTTGDNNTAIGFNALFSNTIGTTNTATGALALYNNTTGFTNTATGTFALYNNTTGYSNTAIGQAALQYNTTGYYNTAIGFWALYYNTTGSHNVAEGESALWVNETGNDNTATGAFALYNNTTGSNNIALGFQAGYNLTAGSNNIYIGSRGTASEYRTIRIGDPSTHGRTSIAGISGVTVPAGVGVIVDTNGQLGTAVSSERFKDAVKPMDKTSEAILALKPVTFRYKHELDPAGIPQFGLVAEEVEKVNPDLVARDDQGKPYTVRYEAVNAMLLNEFLKEHRKVQDLEANAARQQKQIDALTAGLQKVTAQLELRKSGPQTVLNNQ
jgi:hypothetical protein